MGTTNALLGVLNEEGIGESRLTRIARAFVGSKVTLGVTESIDKFTKTIGYRSEQEVFTETSERLNEKLAKAHGIKGIPFTADDIKNVRLDSGLGYQEATKGRAGKAMSAAAAGAAAGSIVPGLGTAVGAAVGLTGSAWHGINKSERSNARVDAALTEAMIIGAKNGGVIPDADLKRLYDMGKDDARVTTKTGARARNLAGAAALGSLGFLGGFFLKLDQASAKGGKVGAALGAGLGLLAGMLFFPIGLLIGPVVGAALGGAAGGLAKPIAWGLGGGAAGGGLGGLLSHVIFGRKDSKAQDAFKEALTLSALRGDRLFKEKGLSFDQTATASAAPAQAAAAPTQTASVQTPSAPAAATATVATAGPASTAPAATTTASPAATATTVPAPVTQTTNISSAREAADKLALPIFVKGAMATKEAPRTEAELAKLKAAYAKIEMQGTDGPATPAPVAMKVAVEGLKNVRIEGDAATIQMPANASGRARPTNDGKTTS